MKKNTISKVAPYLVIAALVVVIMYLEGCFGPSNKGETVSIGGKDYVVVNRKIDTFIQVKKEIVYRDGKKIPYAVEVIREVPANVDTPAILKDYYSRFFYRDTFKLKDSLGYFVINDTVTKNKIASRKIESSLKIPTIKEIVYLKELTNDFYVGPSLQIGNSISLGADAHLKTKKEMLFGFGVGVNSNVSPYVRGSVSWKINK